MDLNQKITEHKIEELRKYLGIKFGKEQTREETIALIVENFWSKNLNDIRKVLG